MARKHVTDLMVCMAVYQHNTVAGWTGPRPMQICIAQTGMHYKIVWAAFERAFRHDLIDFGTSLRGCWLEPKGLALINTPCPECGVAPSQSAVYWAAHCGQCGKGH